MVNLLWVDIFIALWPVGYLTLAILKDLSKELSKED
jgi:hypothetical protein